MIKYLYWSSGLSSVSYSSVVRFKKVGFKDLIRFVEMRKELFNKSIFNSFIYGIETFIRRDYNYFLLNELKETVGIISFEVKDGEISIMNLGILEGYRRKRYAYDAMSKILMWCHKNKVFCTLSCKDDNVAALSMYSKLNFKIV